MKRYSSNYVYSKKTGLLKYAIVEISDDNQITIIDTQGKFKEIHSLEFYSGLIIVGELNKEEFIRMKDSNQSLDNLFSIVGENQIEILSISSVDFKNQELKKDSKIISLI
ncbi:MAG: hypothetical protein N4A32_07205 [Marinifilaceae bacterium]|jgi:hypothetical protein|nr:hypothetical protein [Marinifilaceae bacterium]